MDAIRKALDELMGKDRDMSIKEKLKLRKHFNDKDVCKFYLLNFCPHDLFPNTKSDLGKCMRRHDQYFLQQFLNDPNKDEYQRKYEQELMDVLESLIAEVDNKMKRSLDRIEAPLPDSEKPKDLVDQIRNIDNKIVDLVEQAERLGELGRLEESENLMRQIDRMKDQKVEFISMTEHPLILKDKQMKVCEVCGAMQALQDNEKRLQTHLEGKLHTGYLKIREHLDILRRRRLDWKRRQEEEKEKLRIQSEMREKEKLRERDNKYNERDNKYANNTAKRRKSSRSRSLSQDFNRKFRDLEKREIKPNRREDDYGRNDRGERGGRDERGDRGAERNTRFEKERSREKERTKEREQDRGSRDRDRGDRGDRGDKDRGGRDRGNRGDRGDRGDKGDRSDRGDRGDRGDRKDKGDRGDRGDRDYARHDLKRDENNDYRKRR